MHGVPVSGRATRGPGGRSWVNAGEADAVCEVVHQMRSEAGQSYFSIGIVTPFRAQVDAISERLEREGCSVTSPSPQCIDFRAMNAM